MPLLYYILFYCIRYIILLFYSQETEKNMHFFRMNFSDYNQKHIIHIIPSFCSIYPQICINQIHWKSAKGRVKVDPG